MKILQNAQIKHIKFKHIKYLLTFFMKYFKVIYSMDPKEGTKRSRFQAGIATTIGVSLISEGISDSIQGVRGMISGSFSWAQWAISIAISLAISLCFGVVKYAKYGKNCIKAGSEGIKKTKSEQKKKRKKEQEQYKKFEKQREDYEKKVAALPENEKELYETFMKKTGSYKKLKNEWDKLRRANKKLRKIPLHMDHYIPKQIFINLKKADCESKLYNDILRTCGTKDKAKVDSDELPCIPRPAYEHLNSLTSGT